MSTRSHHIVLGGSDYICKFDSRTPFDHTYDDPFISRQSVSSSRSEGDLERDLLFTQTSWRQGEGQLRMNSDGEERYYSSTGVDIAGDSTGLQLIPTQTKISGGTGQPDFDTHYVNLEPGFNGLYVAFPTGAGSDSYSKEVWGWTGSVWMGSPPAKLNGANAMNAGGGEIMWGMTIVKGHAFFIMNTGMYRSDDYSTKWSTDVTSLIAGGTDGTDLFVAQSSAGATGYDYTIMWKYAPTQATGGTATGVQVSGELEGTTRVHCVRAHAGTIYVLTNIAGHDKSMLYRYDGDNFVPWKELPDGFHGMHMVSDGSVLYISGHKKCSDGNDIGHLYYITGSSSSEALGKIGEFGDRDGSSDMSALAVWPFGDSTYFGWEFHGGVGRYDHINGGISRSFYQSTARAEANEVTRIRNYDGNLYYIVKGSGGTDTALYKVSTGSSFGASATATLDSSYVDFGFPFMQKSYNSIGVMTTETQEGVAAAGTDIEVFYSVDGDTSTWTSLGKASTMTPESDSSSTLKKYLFPLTSNDVKAHSLAYRIKLYGSSAGTSTPKVSAVSIHAMSLLRSPNFTRPRNRWKFSVVLADRVSTKTGAIETGKQSTNYSNIRSLVENQTVTTLKTFADSTTYSVVVTSASDVAVNDSPDKDYEATMDIEVMEVFGG